MAGVIGGRKGGAVVALLLAAWVLLLYARVRTFAFINLDDTRYLLLNPAVQGGLSWESVRWAFGNIHVGYWMPLTWLSFLTDITLFGLKPGALHAVNLLLHVGNTLLFFLLVSRLTGRFWPAAVVALLFGVHPQHVEAVAWIVERKEMLAGLFGLLALHLHVSAVTNGHGDRCATPDDESRLSRQTMALPWTKPGSALDPPGLCPGPAGGQAEPPPGPPNHFK
ncbi:MAG: hypothetical protein HQL66_03610, partial [Magnetococcales bacterium]|nr:hypothetical protein [Magnetococcales bacterium]